MRRILDVVFGRGFDVLLLGTALVFGALALGFVPVPTRPERVAEVRFLRGVWGIAALYFGATAILSLLDCWGPRRRTATLLLAVPLATGAGAMWLATQPRTGGTCLGVAVLASFTLYVGRRWVRFVRTSKGGA